MRDWLHTIAFQKLTSQQLKWVFRGLLVITVLDWLMPDALPFVDELGLAWFTWEVWRELKGRKDATQDVKAEDVQKS